MFWCLVGREAVAEAVLMRGRQMKRWECNIKEWTGLELSDTLRKAESRGEWRELVAKLWIPFGP